MMGREKEKKVWINAVMIKIRIRTRTKWESAEAAGSSNFNKGFLSSILQASPSLSVLFPHSAHITAFCHPSHFGAPSFCGTFPSLCVKCSPRLGICDMLVFVSYPGKHPADEKAKKCVWLRMRRTPRKRRIHLLWYTDKWWLVCLPVFHLERINAIYSPEPLTTNFGHRQYAGARRRRNRKERNNEAEEDKWEWMKGGGKNSKAEGRETVIWGVWWQRPQLLLLLRVYLAEPQLAPVCGHSLQPDKNRVCVCFKMHGHICCIVCECQRYGVWAYSGAKLLGGLPHLLQPALTLSSSISAKAS